MKESLAIVGKAFSAALVLATITATAFLFGLLMPANASMQPPHIVHHNHGFIPAWITGAHCTRAEAHSFHVKRADCVNLVGSRITITLTHKHGGIQVHKS